MSLASSSPELFVNVVTTFLTRSTMGVGTTVGSATFNVLGLASFIGLAARGVSTSIALCTAVHRIAPAVRRARRQPN